MKWIEIKKFSQKQFGLCRNLYVSFCVCVRGCVCVCVYLCLCVLLLCVYVVSGIYACACECACAARLFYRMLVVDVSDIATVLSGKIIYLFLHVLVIVTKEQNFIIACWRR